MPLAPFLLLGIGSLLAVAWTATDGNVATGVRRGLLVLDRMTDQVFANILRRVKATEAGGRWDAQQKNLDGNGLSFGIIQWTQRGGGLGRLLTAMHGAAPARFAEVFGPSWQTLLAQLTSQDLAVRMAPVAGAVLWAEPWTARFSAAGNDPTFQNVQLKFAQQDDYWPAAVAGAKSFGVVSERSLALFYDIAVNQGAGGMRSRLASAIAAVQQRGVTDAPTKLRLLREAARAPYITRTQPASLQRSKATVWKPAEGGVWHAWAGTFNLYTGISNRTQRLLDDPDLSDAPITLT